MPGPLEQTTDSPLLVLKAQVRSLPNCYLTFSDSWLTAADLLWCDLIAEIFQPEIPTFLMLDLAQVSSLSKIGRQTKLTQDTAGKGQARQSDFGKEV